MYIRKEKWVMISSNSYFMIIWHFLLKQMYVHMLFRLLYLWDSAKNFQKDLSRIVIGITGMPIFYSTKFKIREGNITSIMGCKY